MIAAGLDQISGHLRDLARQNPLVYLPDLDARRNNLFDGLSLKCAIENKTRPFKDSFFFRTHLVWNDLPTDLKEQSESDVFRSNLKRHLWDVMIDPH